MRTVAAESSAPPAAARSDDGDPEQDCLALGLPPPIWTKPEAYTWQQICRRDWADFAPMLEDEIDPWEDSDAEAEARALSSDFLLTIVSDPRFVAVTPYTGIRIKRAYFPDDIHVNDVTYDKPLNITHSVFGGQLDLKRYRTESYIELQHDWFKYGDPEGAGRISLNAEGINVGQSLSISGCQSEGQITLEDAAIGMHLDLTGCTIKHAVSIDRARINGVLYIEEATIGDEIGLRGAEIGQDVWITDTSISRLTPEGKTEFGALRANLLHVKGDLNIGDSSEQIEMPARLVGEKPPAPKDDTTAGSPLDENSANSVGAPAPVFEQNAPQPSPMELSTQMGPLPANATNELAEGSVETDETERDDAAAGDPRSFSVRLNEAGLLGARIDGELYIRRLEAQDVVDLEDATVGDDIWLTESNAKKVFLSGASARGFVLLHGLHVTEFLQLYSANIRRSVVMDRHTSINSLRMPGAIIRGSLYFAGARLAEGAEMRAITVDGDIVAEDGTRLDDALELSFAQVGGSLDLRGGTYRRVLLRSVTVNHDLTLGNGSTYSALVDASFARIGGSLDLTGGKFASVDLTGADIGAELRLAAHDVSGPTDGQFHFEIPDVADMQTDAGLRFNKSALPSFGDKSVLTLRNTTANTLQDVAESWPCVLQLEGFSYERLIHSKMTMQWPGGADPCASMAASHDSASVAAAQTPIRPGGRIGIGIFSPNAGAVEKARIKRDSGAEFISWLARQKRFSPQPYVQLASVLRQSGDAETAKRVLFAGKAREWRVAGFWMTIWLSLQWAFTGFGLYPYVSFFWVLALIAIGTIIFPMDPAPELQQFSLLKRCIYSLDMLIPAAHLRHHASIELTSWPRYYLYAHRLMGYVLLSFLAAALLGVGSLG